MKAYLLPDAFKFSVNNVIVKEGVTHSAGHSVSSSFLIWETTQLPQITVNPGDNDVVIYQAELKGDSKPTLVSMKFNAMSSAAFLNANVALAAGFLPCMLPLSVINITLYTTYEN